MQLITRGVPALLYFRVGSRVAPARLCGARAALMSSPNSEATLRGSDLSPRVQDRRGESKES